MTTSYHCKYFELHELVPPVIFRKYELRPDLLWQKFDVDLLRDIDHLRELFGICTINDWFWHGHYRFSGCRPFDCPEGADLSDHKCWNAFDLKFEDTKSDIVRKYIIKHQEDFPGIFVMEIETRWLHIAKRNWNKKDNGILLIKP